MKHIIRTILLAVTLLSLISCEEKEPESYYQGVWSFENAHVKYNGLAYTTTSPSIVIDSKPYAFPAVLTLSSGGQMKIDGMRGTYKYKDKSGTLEYNGITQEFTIPYGILFLDEKISNVSSIIVNGKKVEGSGDVTVTSWFYKD